MTPISFVAGPRSRYNTTMLRRTLIAISFASIVALIPAAGLADVAVDQGASAAGLGPAASSGTSTGGSSADSATLQPAGNNPLQSATGASNGLTAPNSNALQAPASDQGTLQVIQGEADGSPYQLTGDSSWAWLWWFGVIVVILVGGFFAWRWLRHPRRTIPPTPADEPEPEPIHSHTLTITIDRPAATVFDYTLDPSNTAKWIDAIADEEANERPPKLGTIYKNQNQDGEWTEYEIVGFEPAEHFTLARSGSSYRVRYSFKPVEAAKAESEAPEDKPSDKESKVNTELEYHEWVEDGELTDLFSPEALQKLKSLLES